MRYKDLMLVDYDGIYVPAMAGEQANELGHVNYQHLERSAEYFDATIDRFFCVDNSPFYICSTARSDSLAATFRR